VGDEQATGIDRVPRARGLSTARSVLRVLTLLARAPQGLRADEVSRTLGKSASTAYNLLDSLCEEGFAVHDHGRYRLADPARTVAHAVSTSALPIGGLAGTLDELFASTHKRAYLAVMRAGRMVVPLVRGQQGMRRIPGLGAELGDNAHALAIGKIALAQLDAAALSRYVGSGLTAFTPDTITDPAVLARQLAQVRRDGLADDREEMAADSCCLAAPLYDERGRAVAAIGISMSVRAFERDRDELTGLLLDVASRSELPAIREDAGRSCPLPSPAPSVALPSAEMEVSA
jgi:DNA-binding IclR family transcriptional regulator